jgi:transcriptional regulator with XRE-family HTH domain
MDAEAPTLAARLLATAQQRSGLTPSEWSAKAGMSRALLHNYLRGRHQPSLPQLDRLLRAAGQQMHVEVRPTVSWQDPGETAKLRRGREGRRRSREEQGQALLDVLSVADAIPVRRRSALRYPVLRDLLVR